MNRPSLLTLLRTAGLLLAAVMLLGINHASAQLVEDLIPPDRNFVSPERFIIEFRAGPFSPSNTAFEVFFPDDSGPLLELELDVIAYSIEDILDLTLGGAIGYASFAGKAQARDDMYSDYTPIDEETTLKILPLTLLATARLDGLARKLGIPVLLTGKLGYTWIDYWSAVGARENDSKFSHGLRWAAQIALDLDTFEPATARVMDEEWGLNHAFLFFELWGFVSVSDDGEFAAEGSATKSNFDDTTWSAGLGFNF